MKLFTGVLSGLFALVLCAPTFAQEVSPARASEIGTQIYASKGVKQLLAPAMALRKLDPEKDEASLRAKVDCSAHPRPYGRPDESNCAFEIEASYGWYADPALLVTVKGFVAKSKLAAGTLKPTDFTIREFSFRIPDPTGLE